MVSKLARQTVEDWKREGLEPTFDDVVCLNALGLKIERNGSSYEVASVPRVAFLGDYIFQEPTVGKRLWLESAMRLFKDDFENQLALTAYALNRDELPSLSNLRVLVKSVQEFRDSVLKDFTDTQIFQAIDYALRGESPDDANELPNDVLSCDYHESGISAIPVDMISSTRRIYLEALSYGVSEGIKDELTLPHLERIVILAALHSGVDVLKGEHAQRVGEFYRACGRIHERLKEEKLTREHRSNG